MIHFVLFNVIGMYKGPTIRIILLKILSELALFIRTIIPLQLLERYDGELREPLVWCQGS